MLPRKIVYSFILLFSAAFANAQKITARLENAWKIFEADSQLRTAIPSLYVINANTGEVVFDKNSKIGLATASTLKVITAASAYEMLGKDFRYETGFYYWDYGKKSKMLMIFPAGDPSFGSWRWPHNNRFNIIKRVTDAIAAKKITISKIISPDIISDEPISGGWIWEDIGNYYGAGAQSLNWNENQFDLILKSGDKIGDPVKIVGTIPKLYFYKLDSKLTSAAKGTGDNAYIYLPAGRANALVRGTIPVNETKFVISGSIPDAKTEFIAKLTDTLKQLKIFQASPGPEVKYNEVKNNIVELHKEVSPELDSLVYWFLKKSINLYGEAFVKTIALENPAGKYYNNVSTESGIDTIVSFWKKRGLDPAELRMVDGSGLSPLNRVTTHAQVTVLAHAKKQSWFKGYYDAFPEYNGMKIKSGTINGVKGFCGYHKAADGNEYIFSFLVNNYNGSATGVVNKMYKVLDVLK